MSDLWTDVWTDLWGEAVPLRRMFDSAFPPTSPPKWEVAAGYIGGNTPHVWTDQEWARQPARYRLPIFTRSTGGDPNADGAASVRWLRAHSVPKGACMALDFETRIDAVYLTTFDAVIIRAGWKVMVYGTRRTVVQNPEPSGGYWMAEWTGTPHLIPGSAATQWSGSGPFGGIYDPNLVADSTPLWDTKEDMLTTEEHDALMWLRANAVSLRDQGVRMTDHGEPDVPGRSNNLAQVRQDLAAGLSAVTSRLDTGLKVTLDLSSATPEQLDQLAALIAGHVAIKGVSYQGTIQLDPKVVA